MKRFDSPLFLGASHIGQVFSIGWAKKFGKCSVYDFDQIKFSNFKNSKLTDEEPNLKKYYKKYKSNIQFIKESEIKKFKNIFITVDTPLDNFGNPRIKEIESFIKKSSNFIGKNSNLIITSQVYCGFCDHLKKTIFKKRKDVNLIYMAETLIMGQALERFLYPERLIFGVEKNIKFLDKFKKLNCPIFIYSRKQAEMVKMAINLYLLNSVSYANVLDQYCEQYGFSFSSIIESIKSDKRIGKFSYINPSLGFGGGHLERDMNTFIEKSKNNLIRNFFQSQKKINNKRIELLINKVRILKKNLKFKSILWIGPSYKKDSFSMLNSALINASNRLKKICNKIYVFDSLHNLEKKKELKKFIVLNSIWLPTREKVLIIFNYSNKDCQKQILMKSKKRGFPILDIGLKSSFDKKNNKVYSLFN